MNLTGIGSLIVLILDVFAILMIMQSASKSIDKLVWVLVVLLLPLIGFIAWYLAGPGRKPF